MVRLNGPEVRWAWRLLGVVLLANPAIAGVPGGVELIPLPEGVEGVWFEGRPVMILPAPQHMAVVGIPLSATPGTLHVTVDGRGGSFEQPFTVVAKDYPEQHVTIENPRMVNPDPADLERINREAAAMRAQYRRFEPLKESPFPLQQPVAGQVSSEFGLRRFFNGEPRRPHSGLDIAAPEGTPIRAPAAGIIALTGEFYFNGNTIIIDHGGGLISMGCHMSAIDVEQGDRVQQGDQIGRVGATGRATGPHLHWSVYLNGQGIDPRAVLALFAEPAADATASGG